MKVTCKIVLSKFGFRDKMPRKLKKQFKKWLLKCALIEAEKIVHEQSKN